MPNNIADLITVSAQVEGTLGLLLLYAWVQHPEIQSAAWWGCAHVLRAASIALFESFGLFPDAITIDFANALLLMSFSVLWTGSRIFAGRKINWVFLFGGTVIWLIGCQMPGLAQSGPVRFLLISGIVAIYTWFAAAELWRSHGGELVSRLPAVSMLGAQGVLFLTNTPIGMFVPHLASTERVFGSIWLTVLSYEAMLFTIAIGFMLMALAKERAAYLHDAAPLLDPVAGIWSRHDFLIENHRLMGAAERKVEVAAILLIDLDNFDQIGQDRGRLLVHRTLGILAATVRAVIHSSDLVIRLDGDEFAVVLFEMPRDGAIAVAEQIRSAFAEQAAIVAGQPVGATVSIGLMPYDGPTTALKELIAMAHLALCQAHESGRNQVKTLDTKHHERGDRGALIWERANTPANFA
jgi:diguanylate cyclase (GGDEF)-like protein